MVLVGEFGQFTNFWWVAFSIRGRWPVPSRTTYVAVGQIAEPTSHRMSSH